MNKGIGQAVPRVEDARFLTGRGRYTDDFTLPDMAHAAVVRSPHPHADIVSIDTTAAEAAPGVLAVLTAEDLTADGLGAFSCDGVPAFLLRGKLVNTEMPLLASGRVRAAGLAVAFVVAETRNQAKCAAELVEVDYRPLQAISEPDQALAAGAPVIWEEAPDNRSFVYEMGDAAAVERAFQAAGHVTKVRLRNNRLVANPMEPRVSIGIYDAIEGRYTLYSTSQGPHRIRQPLAGKILKVPERRLRVISNDVGGGFGVKGSPYPEDGLVLWAARRLGRPVKWVADRLDGFLSDRHSRDQVAEAEMAFDAEGRIAAMRVRQAFNLGGYLSPTAGITPMLGTLMLSGVYDIPAIHVVTDNVFTNTAPTSPYRGAGRPEAAYVLERLLDQAAREMGLDPVGLRRRNLVRPDQMPYRTGLAYTYDCGEFEAVMDKALALADWDGFAARKRRSEEHGLLRGRGIATYLENSGIFNERMEIRFDPSGGLTILSGTFSHGQGHETVFAQIVSELLGVPFEDIRLVQGDTDRIAIGRGAIGSRSMMLGGGALTKAANIIIDKGRRIAGHMLEAAPEDVEFAEGAFTVAGTDRRIAIQDVARAAFTPIGWPPELGIGLEAVGDFDTGFGTFPNGCQVAEVEIDPATGVVRLDKFTITDDVGRVVNPLLMAGQLHGGIAQGVGQALMENVVYDRDGQLVSASFQDYCMPRADDLPMIANSSHEVPTRTNPLGVKGGGESGTVGAPPAVMNAVNDALAAAGAGPVDMPATPERVWRALQAAKKEAG